MGSVSTRVSNPEISLVSTPQTVGKYEILGLLGRGGMAEVFLARTSGAAGFEKKVALKRLSQDRLHDEVLVRSLINEARLAAQLTHPNLIQVLEFELIDGSYSMVMEYVDGVTLEQVLQRCRQLDLPLPPGVAAAIIMEACAGLEFAHTAKSDAGLPLKLVHRDIKPSNLMITRSGQIKIMDFGIARAATNPYQTTRSGAVKGTLAYMSPEQMSGEALDPRSDLFSLGVVLYELLTLERLFEDSNLLLLAHQLIQGLRPEAAASLEARCKPLVPIVQRMLEPDRDKRISSARALLGELRPFANGISDLELADFVADLSILPGTSASAGTLPSLDRVQSNPPLSVSEQPTRPDAASGSQNRSSSGAQSRPGVVPELWAERGSSPSGSPQLPDSSSRSAPLRGGSGPHNGGGDQGKASSFDQVPFLRRKPVKFIVGGGALVLAGAAGWILSDLAPDPETASVSREPQARSVSVEPPPGSASPATPPPKEGLVPTLPPASSPSGRPAAQETGPTTAGSNAGSTAPSLSSKDPGNSVKPAQAKGSSEPAAQPKTYHLPKEVAEGEPGGWVVLNSDPWSRVYLNDVTDDKWTTLFRRRFAPGYYRARLVTEDGKTVTYEFFLAEGGRFERFWDVNGSMSP